MNKQDRWRQMLRRQARTNAERWIALLEGDTAPAGVADEYDNILRALENVLRQEDDDVFALAFRLIQQLHAIVSGFADWDRWLNYLTKALARADALDGTDAERARLLELIGDVHRLTGALDAAETTLHQSADLYKALQDGASYTRVLARLGDLYNTKGDLEKGESYCRRALFLATSLNDAWLTAYVNLNLSRVYLNAQAWPDALAAAQKAHAGFEESGDSALAVRALLTVVAGQAQLGQWRTAKQTAQTVMKLAADDVRTLVRLHINLGGIAFEQGHYGGAEAAWQKALRLHSQLQEPGLEATLHNNLGMVYTKLKEWEEADAKLRKAAAIHRERDDLYKWSNTMDNLADLYEAQGDASAYREILEETINRLSDAAQAPQVRELREKARQRLDAGFS